VDEKGQPIKDLYEIAFACKGACDVAVAIHDASGRIVRHIVYGVLGANAPEPLKQNSLEQRLAWDGKDDAGKYVKDAGNCQARVSLGLKPTFDRLLNWHPKDTTAGGIISAVGADPDGVYVLEFSCRNQLRKYDHDAKYVRTLWPFPADKFETLAHQSIVDLN
jgi:hypothetical protein